MNDEHRLDTRTHSGYVDAVVKRGPPVFLTTKTIILQLHFFFFQSRCLCRNVERVIAFENKAEIFAPVVEYTRERSRSR